MTTKLTELKTTVLEKIELYNAALKTNDHDKIAAAEAAVKDAEETFAEQSQNDMFDECAATPDPMYTAIKAGFFDIIRHKIDRDEGIITGMHWYMDRRQIDLVKLCKKLQKPIEWKAKVEKLGELLCKRVMNDVGKNTSGLDDKYKMSKQAKGVKLEGDPTSNSGLLKLLQTVVDSMLFEDAGDGKNKYKINNRDVKYMLHCYGRKGGVLTIAVANTSTLIKLVAEIMYRVTNELEYDVKFKMVRGNTVANQKAENETKKADKKAEKKPAKKEEPIVAEAPKVEESAEVAA